MKTIVFATVLCAVTSPILSQSSPSLAFFGRASVKIKAADGTVIYIDPYAQGDYSEAADIILVSHGHSDHNMVSLTNLKPGAVILAPAGAVRGKASTIVKEGGSMTIGSVTIHVVPAYNANHARASTVGFVIDLGGTVIYHAGDTSYIPEMPGFASFGIDYALLPCDGFYNMGTEEASRCATEIKARYLIPIHSDANSVFDEKRSSSVPFKGLIVAKPGIPLVLEAKTVK